MSERKPFAYLPDMLNCIEHIQDYSSNITFNDFSSDFMIVEACLYNIQMAVIKSELPSFETRLKKIHSSLIEQNR